MDRPWGHYFTAYQTPHLWVKTIVVNPESQLSYQLHNHREEHWSVSESGLMAIIGEETIDLLPGVCYTVGYRVPHRIVNKTAWPKVLTEVATGNPDESDIVRILDDYGRESL